jgi:Fe-S cluster assembly iron-binding protein IscA
MSKAKSKAKSRAKSRAKSKAKSKANIRILCMSKGSSKIKYYLAMQDKRGGRGLDLRVKQDKLFLCHEDEVSINKICAQILFIFKDTYKNTIYFAI